MTVFDDAAAAIFADANFGVPAIWRANGDGLPVACRAIVTAPNPEFGQKSRAGTIAAAVDADALTGQPGRGDTLAFGAAVYRVEDAARDDLGTMWTLTLSVIA